MLSFFKKTEKAVQKTRDGWFSRVAHIFDRGSLDEGVWEELEEVLISADVGVSTTRKLLDMVKAQAQAEKLKEGSQVRAALKAAMVRTLAVKDGKLPAAGGLRVVMVVGVNGSGKTTSIAKLARYHASRGAKVMLAAADTFRAAAIEQLQLWGQRAGVEVVANRPGGDPGSVVFDALQAAMNRKADVLIVDTAGRLHTKYNLMEELKKVRRIISKAYAGPVEVVLVLDATTGQNGLSQAKHFGEAVEVDRVFLSKLDGTAKGGIVLAICDQLQLPIAFIGTGEGMDDIAPFDPQAFVDALFESGQVEQPGQSGEARAA